MPSAPAFAETEKKIDKKNINVKTVSLGLALQFIFAIFILKTPFGAPIFSFLDQAITTLISFSDSGANFLFTSYIDGVGFHPGLVNFAFKTLPTIIFFSSLVSVLYHFGVIQIMVKFIARSMQETMGTSGSETLSVAGNIFLGQTEAPLLIKAYLEKMNKSEILLVMIGGMATVAGAVLAAYIGFLGGDNAELQLFYAKHLLAASVMAAPGAIVISKILFPQIENINTSVSVSKEKIGSNILESIANGTTEGLKLAVNVGAMLLVFVAFIAKCCCTAQNFFFNRRTDEARLFNLAHREPAHLGRTLRSDQEQV